MEHHKILKIDDSSFECKSIIEFTSLIKILFKLSERQKYLEDKIDLINNRVDDKEKRLNNLEIKVEGESKSEDLKIIQAFQYTPKTTEKKSSGKAENFDRHSSENSLDDKREEDEEKEEMEDKEDKEEMEDKEDKEDKKDKEEKEENKEEGKKEVKERKIKEKEKEKEKEEEKEKEDEKD